MLSVSNTPITLGMVFWPAVIIGGIVILVCVLASIFGDAWKH
jgi:hypothetical protein